MSRALLLDTGPLVAYLNSHDERHEWACEVMKPAALPLLTCEPVVTEACHLLRHVPGAGENVLEFLQSGAAQVGFRLPEHLSDVRLLMHKYRDVPMSIADACLVRMAETLPDATVITADRHFLIYRIHGRRVIPTIMPPGTQT